jgi:Arc/MetJ-type ribon-helix-helix transcriptional regulator
MSSHYITAEEHLPTAVPAETTLQITDAQTKRIFEAQVRIARQPDALTDPEPLTVVTGPHESDSETWYVQLLDDVELGVDEPLLRSLADEQESTSNIVNTRSDDLKVLLRYLVESGEYDSTAEALRTVVFERLAEERPDLLRAYEGIRTEFETDPLRDSLPDREEP